MSPSENCNDTVLPLKERLREVVRAAGAQKMGVAKAAPVAAKAQEELGRWLGAGCHAGMEYMARHEHLRSDPRLLLEGAQAVVVCAFSYYHKERQSPQAAKIAMYAHGSDYHEVLRRRLAPALELLQGAGYSTRLCIDSAPLAERYWAQQAGVGFIGRNGMLILPGLGSRFFLATILTDAPLVPDEPATGSCLGCGRCLRSCPGQAFVCRATASGLITTVDARRCLSYLTIEHRGELPQGLPMPGGEEVAMSRIMRGQVFGCDICQDVCPHNAHHPETEIEEFRLRPQLRTLTAEELLTMPQERFSAIFSHSPVKRAKLAGIQRNAAALLSGAVK